VNSVAMRFGILFAIELAVFSWEVATATEQCVASEDSNSCSSQVPSLMQKQHKQAIKTMPSEEGCTSRQVRRRRRDQTCECRRRTTRVDSGWKCDTNRNVMVVEGGESEETPECAPPFHTKTGMNSFYGSRNANEEDCTWMCTSNWDYKDRCQQSKFSTDGAGTCHLYDCVTTFAPTAAPPTPPTPPHFTFKVVTYNLYWWNAFRDHPWKGVNIIANINDVLQPDILGTQECDDPGKIKDDTGLVPVSSFDGAQGTFVKPSLVLSSNSGKYDINAAGFWGVRWVTWVKHTTASKSFFHFNTHWCVQDCNDDTRDIGARNMLDKINELTNNLETPAIITGDFNAFGGSRRRRLNEKGPNEFLQNGFEIAIENYVDGIFYSTGHWSVGATLVGEMAGSDHKPLVAELTLL